MGFGWFLQKWLVSRVMLLNLRRKGKHTCKICNYYSWKFVTNQKFYLFLACFEEQGLLHIAYCCTSYLSCRSICFPSSWTVSITSPRCLQQKIAQESIHGRCCLYSYWYYSKLWWKYCAVSKFSHSAIRSANILNLRVWGSKSTRSRFDFRIIEARTGIEITWLHYTCWWTTISGYIRPFAGSCFCNHRLLWLQ